MYNTKKPANLNRYRRFSEQVRKRSELKKMRENWLKNFTSKFPGATLIDGGRTVVFEDTSMPKVLHPLSEKKRWWRR